MIAETNFIADAAAALRLQLFGNAVAATVRAAGRTRLV